MKTRNASKLGDTEVSGRWQWVRAAQQLDVSLFQSSYTQMNRQHVSSLEVGCMPASHVVRFQLMSSRCPSSKQIQIKKIQHLRFCEPVICKFDDTLPTTSLVMIKYIE